MEEEGQRFPYDRLAVALIAVLTVLAVVSGFRLSENVGEVDEVVYRQTLLSMGEGDGYYHATREALIDKEGAAPSNIRAIRPPTLFLLLYRLPPWSWRWAAGLVFAAVMALAWRLSRPLAPWAGPVGVGMAGLWMMGAAPWLYLHAELWGLPFLLGGLLRVRAGDDRGGAALTAMAPLFRELYAAPLVLGLVLAKRRGPWLVALAVVGVLAVLHFSLGQEALSSTGHQPGLGTNHSPTWLLGTLSPSDRPFGWVIGVAGTALGLVGMARRRGVDRAARLMLASALVLIPVTTVFGRPYWGLVYGAAIAAFAPAAFPTRTTEAGG